MAEFDKIVSKVIEKSDIVLEVLDARFIQETRNARIEQVIKKKKILIHVINKCDHVDKRHLDKAKRKLENCVFVSAKEHLGTTLLKQKIKALANKKRIKKPIVGVIGCPNVGKSSLINSLKGSYSAKTSQEAGYTKGEQYLRVGRNFLMIDTPGVITRDKQEEEELVLIGAKNPFAIKDPDLALIQLLNNHPGLIEGTYGVEVKDDKEDTIEDIALKLNLKRKGNLPDIERASRKVLHDWIRGKITA
ncbi:50S ribosome-binding GTPase [Candidatus Woesearchaeota archaeon]|nr:50S ribosome-binding GTPase [Candidatus Woesearchaeota archaeon]